MVEKDFGNKERSFDNTDIINSLVNNISSEREVLIPEDSNINPFLQTVVNSVSREIDVSRPLPTNYYSHITDVYYKNIRRDIIFSKRLIIIEHPDFNIILLGLFSDNNINLHHRNFKIVLFSGKKKEDQKDSIFKINYIMNRLEMEELNQESSILMLEEMKKASEKLSRKKTLKERISKRVGIYLYNRTN